MEEKDFNKFMIIIIIVILLVLSFLIIKPLFTAIILGLFAAYIFYPLYRRLNNRIKSKNLSALIIVALVTLIIVLPLILLFPYVTKQLFDLYLSIRNVDIASLLKDWIPVLSSSPEMAGEVIAATSNFNQGLSNLLLTLFEKTITNIPIIALDIVIILFTFFFALKGGENFKQYFSTLFPFPKEYRDVFYDRFGKVTNSVIYAHFVVGIAQAIIAGIGFFLFGIPGALLLTIATLIVGILPVLGPWLVWVPTVIILFITGNNDQAIMLLIYSLFVVNLVDILLRPRIVASKSEMNEAVALIAALGGIYAFGITGFIVGPLIIAILILMIELYKNKKTESMILKNTENKPEA